MNAYRVISEMLYSSGAAYDPPEPPEDYCIVELVVAKSRGQAKWLAWQTDLSFNGGVADMPRFSVRKAREASGEPRIVTMEDEFQDCWVAE